VIFNITANSQCNEVLKKAADLIISFLQEENVTVEDFDKELDLNGFVHALCRNAHGFLQTISCMLPVLQLSCTQRITQSIVFHQQLIQ